jgi:UDP-2,4-diacetamido-2,4,6-trideoxy-beta-L-altropyranose hydrolase
MRCIALAQAWQDLGGTVTFLSRDLPHALAARLTSEGFNHLHLPSEANDLEKTCFHAKESDWVVIDGYQFDTDFCDEVVKSAKHVLLIDDLGDLNYYSTELVLNQNITSNCDMYKQRSANSSLLLSGRYALLRREFQLPPLLRDYDSPCERVLVTLGGSDPQNVTLKVVEALISQKQLHAKIVLGAANPHKEILMQYCLQENGRIELLYSVENMVTLMDWAQIAISAGGTSVLELASRGLPTLLITIADNQSAICETMHQEQIMRSIGWHGTFTAIELSEVIRQFTSKDAKNQRAVFSARSMQLVDAKGASRTAFEMLARLAMSFVHVRPANLQDTKLAYDWANDRVTRSVSFNQNLISWEDHQGWYINKLNQSSCRLLIGEDKDKLAFGIVRFDLQDDVAIISINLEPTMRGKGLGILLILVSCLEILHHSSVRQIRALIKPDNRSSLKAFQRAGFEQISDVNVNGQAALCLVLY